MLAWVAFDRFGPRKSTSVLPRLSGGCGGCSFGARAEALEAGPGLDDRAVSLGEVRDALAHLYDIPYLQAHPLAPAVAGSLGRGKELRRTLLAAIEAVRPVRAGTASAHATRRHAILTLRYVEGLAPPDVERRLAISRSLYFREVAAAVAAVAAALASQAPLGLGSGAANSLLTPPAARQRDAIVALPASSFVGRAEELATVAELLRRHRLVTLTGPGGCGKTRLALHAAAAWSAGRARVVELAPIADGRFVTQTAAAALGVPEAPDRPILRRLVDALADAELLLVLDNCEHVLDACAELSDALVRGCPAVRVLATSREPLRLDGEATWRVPSLAAPAEGETDIASIASSPAVRLFTDRAQAAAPGFQLTATNATLVAELCWRLDGLPLALELAAARTRALPLGEIVGQLDDRFRLLTGGNRSALPRQQTLQATLDWSHGLLSPPEQVLFRRLAVFAGGWTLDAVEAVCGGAGLPASNIADLVAGLVDKSLVDADLSGPGRYGYLETVRAYATAQSSGEPVDVDRRGADRLHARHFAWMLRLARRSAPELAGTGGGGRRERLEAEIDNLRAAFAWALSRGDAGQALRLGSALWWFWDARGSYAEGRAVLGEALALRDGRRPTIYRTASLIGAARLAMYHDDYGEGGPLFAEALDAARALGHRALAAHALFGLGMVAQVANDFASARARFQAAFDEAQAVDHAVLAGLVLDRLAMVARSQGLLDEARRLIDRGMAIAAAAGDQRHSPFESRAMWSRCMANLWRQLGLLAEDVGDHAAALSRFRESVGLVEAARDPGHVAWSMAHLGEAELELGDIEAGRRHLTESLAVARQLGWRFVVATALLRLGRVEARRGDEAAAAARYAECLVLRHELGDRAGVAEVVEQMAGLAAGRGDAERTLRLAAAAAALRGTVGAPAPPVARARLDGWIALAKARCPDAEAVWAQGGAMSLGQIVAFAGATDG